MLVKTTIKKLIEQFLLLVLEVMNILKKFATEIEFYHLGNFQAVLNKT